MNNNQVFVPAFPPPPLHQLYNPNPVPESLSTHIDFSLYRTRFRSYLNSRQNQKESNQLRVTQPQKGLKLNDVTTELRIGFDLIEMMKKDLEKLSQNASSMPTSQWDEEMFQLNSKADELSAIHSKYKDGKIINCVQTLIKKRQTKRDRIKMSKADTQAFKKYEAIKRQQKHQEIDKWLEKNAEEIREQRQQIETKQRAEQILMDVKSRKTEAERSLLVLNSLKELYHARNRDKPSSTQNGAEFNQEINEIHQIWLAAYKKYETEEKELQKFLNCTNSWEEWRDSIFGEPKKEDAIFALKKKDNGINQLIRIRNLWDKFIVPDDNTFGSNIPLGWAFPNANPSDKWNEYRTHT